MSDLGSASLSHTHKHTHTHAHTRAHTHNTQVWDLIMVAPLVYEGWAFLFRWALCSARCHTHTHTCTHTSTHTSMHSHTPIYLPRYSITIPERTHACVSEDGDGA